MLRGFQSEASDPGEELSQIDNDMVLLGLHELVYTINLDLKPWEAKSCQQCDEAAICVLGRHQRELFGIEGILTYV